MPQKLTLADLIEQGLTAPNVGAVPVDPYATARQGYALATEPIPQLQPVMDALGRIPYVGSSLKMGAELMAPSYADLLTVGMSRVGKILGGGIDTLADISRVAAHSGMPQKLNAGAIKFPMPEKTPRGATLTVMSPQEYLRQVNEAQRINFESAPPPIRKLKTIRNLVKALKSGESIETPSLTLRQGKIVDQEGRHRAVAAIEAGVNEIPVFVFERK